MQRCPIVEALIDHLPHVNSISNSPSNYGDVSYLTSKEQIPCKRRHIRLAVVNFEFSMGGDRAKLKTLPGRNMAYRGTGIHGLATMPHTSRLRMHIKITQLISTSFHES